MVSCHWWHTDRYCAQSLFKASYAFIFKYVNNWKVPPCPVLEANGTGEFIVWHPGSPVIWISTEPGDISWLLHNVLLFYLFFFYFDGLSFSFIWLVMAEGINHRARCRCVDVTSWWPKVQHLPGTSSPTSAIWNGSLMLWSPHKWQPCNL